MRKIDQFILDKIFQRLADTTYETTGLTNYALARTCFGIALVINLMAVLSGEMGLPINYLITIVRIIWTISLIVLLYVIELMTSVEFQAGQAKKFQEKNYRHRLSWLTASCFLLFSPLLASCPAETMALYFLACQPKNTRGDEAKTKNESIKALTPSSMFG